MTSFYELEERIHKLGRRKVDDDVARRWKCSRRRTADAHTELIPLLRDIRDFAREAGLDLYTYENGAFRLISMALSLILRDLPNQLE